MKYFLPIICHTYSFQEFSIHIPSWKIYFFNSPYNLFVCYKYFNGFLDYFWNWDTFSRIHSLALGSKDNCRYKTVVKLSRINLRKQKDSCKVTLRKSLRYCTPSKGKLHKLVKNSILLATYFCTLSEFKWCKSIAPGC